MACIFLFLRPRSISIFQNILIPLRNLFLNQLRSLPFKNLALNLSIQINFWEFQIWKVLKKFTFTYPSLTSIQKFSLKYLKPLILNSKSLKSIWKSNMKPIYSDSWFWPETLRQPSGLGGGDEVRRPALPRSAPPLARPPPHVTPTAITPPLKRRRPTPFSP
jgi:hypothetical protein